MTDFIDYDDIDFDEFDDFGPTSIDDIKNNLPTYDIKKICQIIVCNRYLNLNKDLTVYCMEELAARRLAGDTFDYENYIDEQYKELPVLNFDMPDLRTMLGQVIGKK